MSNFEHIIDFDKLKSELLQSARKVETCQGIYVLIDKGEIVYVGQSYNVVERIHKHVGEKVFDSYSIIAIKNKCDLNEIEGILIMTYKPRYNITVPDNSMHGNMKKLKARYGLNANAIKKVIAKHRLKEYLGYYRLAEVDAAMDKEYSGISNNRQ